MKLLGILESVDNPNQVVSRAIIDAATQVFDQSVCYYIFLSFFNYKLFALESR